MYQVNIENGKIDWNENESIQETGYVENDYTNGGMTCLSFVRTLTEVNEIIDIVKNDAIDIHVWTLVDRPLTKKIRIKIRKNLRNFF